MTIFDTPRFRVFALCATVVFVALFGLLFTHHIAAVHASRRSVAEADARVVFPTDDSHTDLRTGSAPNPTRTPVVVELFTSEGCSSCPPADALLAHLLKDQPVPNADILVLEEHVDYWNSLGWNDRFSSHQLTARQTQYAHDLHLDSVYTPQMVVDGTNQFVGNDSSYAVSAISHSARAPKLNLAISALAVDGRQLSGTISLTAGTTDVSDADLYAAVVESSASTEVKEGENGGRTLQHVSIVRNLQRIGRSADAVAAPLKFTVCTPADTAAANLRVVILLQRAGQGAILAAASSPQAPVPAPAISTAVHSGT
ncbi:MAG TPA: DUF1223 domain-containing protein [Acidobacteriaceae bacterium]